LRLSGEHQVETACNLLLAMHENRLDPNAWDSYDLENLENVCFFSPSDLSLLFRWLILGLQILADNNIALSVVTKPQNAATAVSLQISLLAVISHIRRPESHALNWFSELSSVSCVVDVEWLI
jgi:hypothetical protein